MSDGGFIVAILTAFIIKWILFPKDYILSRLAFFKNQILKSETISESYNIQQESIKLASDSNSNSHEESNIFLDTPTNIWETSHSGEIVSEEKKSSEKYSSHRNDSQEKNIVHEMNILEKFFAENLLAKVWWIFVFLGVLFLLGLIYTMIGPVTKLVLWFTIWGLCYASWVWLDKKWYIEESRIILWVALLINYLVILWWRYFLWNDETSSAMILSVGLTFFFLVANTIIAIIVRLEY